jgi:ankyrin repeat protein
VALHASAMDPAGTLLAITEIFIRLQDFSDLFDEAPRTLNSIRAQIKVVETGVKRIQEWMHFTDPTSKAVVQEALQEAIATVDDSVGSLKEDLDVILSSGPKMTKLLGRQGSDKWTQTKFAWNEARLSKHVTDMRECALLLSFTLTVCQLPIGRPAEHAIEELGIGARTLSRAHKSTRETRRFMLDDAKTHTRDQSVDFQVFLEGVLDAEKTLPEGSDTEKSIVEDVHPTSTTVHSPPGSTPDGPSPFGDLTSSIKTYVQELSRTRNDELFLDSPQNGASSVPVIPPKTYAHDSEVEGMSTQSSGAYSGVETLSSTTSLVDTPTEGTANPRYRPETVGTYPNLNSSTGMQTYSSPLTSQKSLLRKPVKSAANIPRERRPERQIDSPYSSEKIMIVPEDPLEQASPEVVSSTEKQAYTDVPLTASPPPYMSRMSSQVFQPNVRSRLPPIRSGSEETHTSVSRDMNRSSHVAPEPNAANTPSCPDIIQAVRDGQELRVQELMKQHGSVYTQDPNTGRTALLEAVHRSNRELCRILLKGGSRPNQQDAEGHTALHIAAICNDSIICRMLLAADASVTVKDLQGRSPLWLAAESGSHESVVSLLEATSSLIVNDPEIVGPFYEVLKRGDVASAEAFLLKHIKLKAIKEPWKLTTHAAFGGNPQMLDLVLVQKGALKATDPEGLTVLHHAARYGHAAMIERLLDMGASWKSQTKRREETALHLAIACGQPSAALALIEHKSAKVTTTDVDGQEPIHLATRTGDFELVTALLTCGAKLKTRSSYGWRPLHIAAAYGHVALIANFITHGVDLEDRLSSPSFKPGKKTNEAARQGYWAEIRWPHEEARALHLAIEFGHAEMAKLLLASGAKIDAVDSQRWQPLHYAAFHCQPEVVELLLEKGASPHATTQDGNTPLGLGFREHGLAASRDDRDRVQYLLQAAGAKQHKSAFSQVMQFRLGGAGTRSARERNMVWHTAEMAEALYRDRGSEAGNISGDDESQRHERRSSAMSSSLTLSNSQGFDRRLSSLSLRKSPI